jgi:hypothetical protein
MPLLILRQHGLEFARIYIPAYDPQSDTGYLMDKVNQYADKAPRPGRFEAVVVDNRLDVIAHTYGWKKTP